jgi:hypothetical protein
MASRHPNKHIEEAVQYAIARGWRVEPSKGHPWGRIYCPFRDREGCRMSVYSTPRHPEDHASDIRRYVDACPHGQGG